MDVSAFILLLSSKAVSITWLEYAKSGDEQKSGAMPDAQNSDV